MKKHSELRKHLAIQEDKEEDEKMCRTAYKIYFDSIKRKTPRPLAEQEYE